MNFLNHISFWGAYNEVRELLDAHCSSMTSRTIRWHRSSMTFSLSDSQSNARVGGIRIPPPGDQYQIVGKEFSLTYSLPKPKPILCPNLSDSLGSSPGLAHILMFISSFVSSSVHVPTGGMLVTVGRKIEPIASVLKVKKGHYVVLVWNILELFTMQVLCTTHVIALCFTDLFRTGYQEKTIPRNIKCSRCWLG